MRSLGKFLSFLKIFLTNMMQSVIKEVSKVGRVCDVQSNSVYMFFEFFLYFFVFCIYCIFLNIKKRIRIWCLWLQYHPRLAEFVLCRATLFAHEGLLSSLFILILIIIAIVIGIIINIITFVTKKQQQCNHQQQQ